MSNKSRILVVAPHPDDEVLGVGGTILRLKSEGALVAWLIVTSMSPENGWAENKIDKRRSEIIEVINFFKFDSVIQLNFPVSRLDQVPMEELVKKISEAINIFKPSDVYLPHRSDVHTDHRIVFDAVSSSTKWFRHPSVNRVLAYETLSESDFSLGIDNLFQPNIFVNIGPFLPKKIEAMKIYESETGIFPFPRSPESINALAMLRGSASGYMAAEAFQLMRERI